MPKTVDPVPRATGLSSAGLKAIVLVLTLVGALGTTFVQRGLPADPATADMTRLTIAVLLELASWAAVPICSWLLVQGLRHTRRPGMYLARLAGLAVIAEVPYDLATSGRPWDFASQNPVWGLVVALIVLLAWSKLRQRRDRWLWSVLVGLAGVAWLILLNVGQRLGLMPLGVLILVFALIFYALDGRENVMMLVGAVVGALVGVLPATGMIVLHFRSGERGFQRQAVYYWLYPVALLVVWFASLAS